MEPDGALFVGTRGSRVYALPNRSLGKRAEQAIVIADDLDTPNETPAKSLVKSRPYKNKGAGIF
ncbi:MAG: hypothetical protein EPN14_09790 [Gallionella sp.]|nr:MAG: hypothetical protein EPN14_09790 [Gallionella sp.]